MAAIDLAREFISRLNGREARGVADLFAPDGAIIDLEGQRYQGMASIIRFVEELPFGTTARVADRDIGTHDVTLRGVLEMPRREPVEVAWHFRVGDERITELTMQSLEPRPDATSSDTR